MSDPPVDSRVLSVYIHYTLGHGVKVAVTLSEVYDPKGGKVASKISEMLKAKLLRHSVNITKRWTTSMRDGLAGALSRNDLRVNAKLRTSVELLFRNSQDHIEDSAAVL
jgi:hypothetical protein